MENGHYFALQWDFSNRWLDNGEIDYRIERDNLQLSNIALFRTMLRNPTVNNIYPPSVVSAKLDS